MAALALDMIEPRSQADVSITLDSVAYTNEIFPLAWLAIGLYPIGLLVLNASLLLRARKAILAQRDTTLSRATKFLHKEFEVRHTGLIERCTAGFLHAPCPPPSILPPCAPPLSPS